MENRVHHGGENRSEKIKYDFSININPLGMPDAVFDAVTGSKADCEIYPDTECTELRNALADSIADKIADPQILAEQIACGNGASDMIYRICGAYRFDRAVIIGPAFSEYERALRQYGCSSVYINAKSENEFMLTGREINQLKTMLTDASVLRTAVFICNPANPVGTVTEKTVMNKIMEICRKNKAVLIVDECFIEFVWDADKLSVMSDVPEGQLIVLRAFTKIYAMAGMRLGYAVFSDAQTAEMVRAYGPPWSVSGPAQRAGLAALHLDGFISDTAEYVAEQRIFLKDALLSCGLRVFDGGANYILFTAPPELGEAMAKRGIAIRDCSDYKGLEDICSDKDTCSYMDVRLRYFRIAVRSHDENMEMLKVMQSSLEEMGWL